MVRSGFEHSKTGDDIADRRNAQTAAPHAAAVVQQVAPVLRLCFLADPNIRPGSRHGKIGCFLHCLCFPGVGVAGTSTRRLAEWHDA